MQFGALDDSNAKHLVEGWDSVQPGGAALAPAVHPLPLAPPPSASCCVAYQPS